MRKAARVCAVLAVVTAIAGNGNAAASVTADRAPTAPRGLVVDDRTNPLGVQGTPQFGWLPQDPDGNEVQSAYQLVVAADGKTVWDSGKVASAAQSWVSYSGPALMPGASYS
jgi:alpha-L-rhamnosidase